VVGIGPGMEDMLTLRALRALEQSEYVLGHRTYTQRIRHLTRAQIIESGMGQEVNRVKRACELATNSIVSLVSGGDPSIYGMASLVVEYIHKRNIDVCYEVIPGITALCAASPLLGCAISGDHVVISLSDHLTPWEVIEKRLKCALHGDFVVVIYNPSSRQRGDNLLKALEIVLSERGDAPIGVVKNAMREGERVCISSASELFESPELVDMHTLLVVGSSETRIDDGVMITPRGYARKYIYR